MSDQSNSGESTQKEGPPPTNSTPQRKVKTKGSPIPILEKIYLCRECPMKFSRIFSLKRHLRVHSGVKPYTCPEKTCGRSFRDSSNLRAHQRQFKHHNWQYECAHCKKAFREELHMERHTIEACRKYSAPKTVVP